MKAWFAIVLKAFIPVALAAFFLRLSLDMPDITDSGMPSLNKAFYGMLSDLLAGIAVVRAVYEVVRGFLQKDQLARQNLFMAATLTLVFLGVFLAYRFKTTQDLESRACIKQMLKLRMLHESYSRKGIDGEPLLSKIETLRNEGCAKDWQFSVRQGDDRKTYIGEGRNDLTKRAWRMTEQADGYKDFEEISEEVYR